LAATQNSPQQRANRFEIPLRRLRDRRRAADELIDAIWQGRIVSEATHASDELLSGHENR
jgi:hypothetical protein